MFKQGKEEIKDILSRWQNILRLRDWDIKLELVNQNWRKTGDVKVDRDDKKAVLMLNVYNPTSQNVEEIIIHELLHIKLWDMDQMLERFLHGVFENDPDDPRFQFAYNQFMVLLESTVEDLTKGYMEVGAENKELCFGRLEKEIEQEVKNKK